MSADLRSSKHHKSCPFEIKSTQPDHRSILMLIISLGLCVNKIEKSDTISCFQLPVRESSAAHDRNTCRQGSSLHCVRAKHDGRYKTYFTRLKPVLTFPTLTLATLDKWATTRNRVFFFFDKNYSWTLLPGSI